VRARRTAARNARRPPARRATRALLPHPRARSAPAHAHATHLSRSLFLTFSSRATAHRPLSLPRHAPDSFGKNRDLAVPFWSTKDAGQQPFSFQIGLGSVIKAWDEGVAGMQLGEVARLTATPDYGCAPPARA
jgi:hypothetical protein